MTPYPKYKPTNIEWIGYIPEHWDAIALKRLSQVKRGASPRPIDDPKYFEENGEFGWVRIADVTASERYLENTLQLLSELGASLSVKRYPGDFFLSIAGTVGKPIVTKIKCCIHDGFVYFPHLKLDPEYLFYIFSTGLPYQGLGKWGTQLNLNTDTVGEINIPLPPLKEIGNVVKYLDEKTTQIDTAITKKQKLIELLKEEKTAIINEAVTKGINHKAKLKPSGIEWLGDVPEHWEVKKLKHVSKFINDGTHGTYGRVENGYRLLSVRNMINDKFVFRDDDSRISEEHFKEISAKFSIQEGDIQLAIVGATLGKIAIVDTYDELFVTQRSVCTIRIDEKICSNLFVFFFMKSSMFQSYLWLNAGFSAQPGIYLGTIQNSYTTCPSLKEQKEITSYIVKHTSKIDHTIGRIEKEIELMQEYRVALISEVVTGKVRVDIPSLPFEGE